jgi:hypothetical protein
LAGKRIPPLIVTTLFSTSRNPGRAEGPVSALTIEHVAQIMPGARDNGLDAEWNAFVSTIRHFEINSKPRLACFLANVAVECRTLLRTRDRRRLGLRGADGLRERERGDGVRFAGRVISKSLDAITSRQSVKLLVSTA